jgi:hypothetical protein
MRTRQQTHEHTREQTREAPLRVRIVRFELAGQLEDESEGYLFSFAAATPADFMEALRAVRALPPWQRVWMPMAQVWWIHEDALSMLARRLPELHDRIRQVAHDRVLRIAQPYTFQWAWQFAPRDVRDAFTALSLRCDASPDEVKTAYRALAKKTHPDRGGSHGAMLALNAAYACALDWSLSTRAAHDARHAHAAEATC